MRRLTRVGAIRFVKHIQYLILYRKKDHFHLSLMGTKPLKRVIEQIMPSYKLVKSSNRERVSLSIF